MKTTWQRTTEMAERKEYPRLKEDIDCEVIIIGGGISGITLAYLLAKENRKVVVAEKGTFYESSNTAYTTAFLTYEIDTDLQDLAKIFGTQKAKAVWESGKLAIDEIERIIKEEEIDCEFTRCNEYIFARREDEWETLKKQALTAKSFSFPVEIKRAGTDLPFKNIGYAILPSQAKFHPLKYAGALREKAIKMGARFFENTEIKSLSGSSKVRAITKDGIVIKGDYAIITTYSPFNRPRQLFAKKGMYMSYVMELSIPKGILAEATYLDMKNPYHYFRVDKDGERDRMILGGDDHRKEIKMSEEKNYSELLSYAEKILGEKNYTITTKWTGDILETIDGLPYIGRYDNENENRMVATGFSGNGMTYSMIAAQILRDKVLGRPNPYSRIYNPLRGYSFTAFYFKMRDYVGEFFGGALKNILKKS